MSRFLHKLERWARPLATPHLFLAIIIGQTFFYLCALLGLFDPTRLMFAWAEVYAGEWWRIFTFPFSPPVVHWALFAFAVACLHSLGQALEAEWGALRFNLFLTSGWVLTLALGLLAPGQVMGNGFIAGSVFLAFAYLNPNHVFHLYLILPVKAKYLAALTLSLYLIYFVTGQAGERLAIIASLGNCALFLGPQLLADWRGGRRRLVLGARRRAEERAEAAAGPRHRCVICGKDSDSHPHEDFRYRADDRCYCSEHVKAPLTGPNSSA